MYCSIGTEGMDYLTLKDVWPWSYSQHRDTQVHIYKSPAVAAVKTHSTVKTHNRARYKGKLTASGHSSPATMTSSIPVALVLASMIAGTLGILLYNIRHTVLSYHAIQSCNNIIGCLSQVCSANTQKTSQPREVPW